VIQKLDSSYFTWQRWRAGSISDLCIPCREELIIKNAYRLRMYTIGYCDYYILVVQQSRIIG